MGRASFYICSQSRGLHGCQMKEISPPCLGQLVGASSPRSVGCDRSAVCGSIAGEGMIGQKRQGSVSLYPVVDHLLLSLAGRKSEYSSQGSAVCYGRHRGWGVRVGCVSGVGRFYGYRSAQGGCNDVRDEKNSPNMALKHFSLKFRARF